jgi:hypothetical protein
MKLFMVLHNRHLTPGEPWTVQLAVTTKHEDEHSVLQ